MCVASPFPLSTTRPIEPTRTSAIQWHRCTQVVAMHGQPKPKEVSAKPHHDTEVKVECERQRSTVAVRRQPCGPTAPHAEFGMINPRCHL
mmetsp:Transcript_102169/g.141188  ORF Transcript_102169/g.141188 Transcript_102169/m.141188 type:complete len:90 (+) Transcript_102169:123-392(+)|eukprot:scaffold163058_cov30-Tisochrysis_lutea.AAC.4